MSKPIENREATQRKVIAIRPRVGGFPYLAETLRQAGVTRNIYGKWRGVRRELSCCRSGMRRTLCVANER